MSIETLKLALEALEEINKLSIGENAICLPAEIDTAMDALRQAIEQAEQAQPVAWMHTKLEGVVVPHRPADLDRHPDRWEGLHKTPPPCPTCEALARTVMMDQTAHDTPPRQTWVGLTGKEVKDCIASTAYNFEAADIARAIEAKLKEKNT